MPAQVTTRAQVNGYQFLIRRLEHALIRGDSRMIHDPMRGQMRALLVGVVIATLIGGAAAVLAFFKPMPNFGNSTIMVSKSNSAPYVRIGDQLHPVLNLASARLIAGKADPPKAVDDKFLNTVPLGPMVGVVGAPTAIHGADDLSMSSWTVCDTTQTPKVTESVGGQTVETTVLANNPVLTEDIRTATDAEMMLAKAGGKTYLVYGGVRAPIDPADPVLFRALRLGDAQVREVSVGLLNAFPLVDPIGPVEVPDIGAPVSFLSSQYRVGSIIRTVDSRGDQLYVVLRDGVQPISEATADIIRYGDPQSPTVAEPSTISPALLGGVPVVHQLHVDHYPTASPQFVRIDPDRVVCMSWQRTNTAAEASTRLLVGHRLPLPKDAKPLRLATADGNGPGLDYVFIKPGTGEYVQATDAEPDSRSQGQLFYVSDTGVRFHIKDLPTAAALGVVGVKDPDSPDSLPQLAPWPVLSLLPPGPELSQEAALIAHDGIAADPSGLKVNPPK